jgi:hypothetical protein
MGVTGIGGLFFRSADPEARASWYSEHLGIEAGQAAVWEQQAGPAVERRPEWTATAYGSFARIHDPEGLPIELWEPAL